MFQHLYVAEKLRELEQYARSHPHPGPPPGRPRRVLRRPAALIGRRVRRLGEALEAWAAPSTPERRAMEQCD
jgi:hypothetical protein